MQNDTSTSKRGNEFGWGFKFLVSLMFLGMCGAFYLKFYHKPVSRPEVQKPVFTVPAFETPVIEPEPLQKKRDDDLPTATSKIIVVEPQQAVVVVDANVQPTQKVERISFRITPKLAVDGEKQKQQK